MVAKIYNTDLNLKVNFLQWVYYQKLDYIIFVLAKQNWSNCPQFWSQDADVDK